jgi:hypothetical protein
MQDFTATQQQAIHTIRFGSLLILKELRIRRNLCKEFEDAYDLDKSSTSMKIASKLPCRTYITF